MDFVTIGEYADDNCREFITEQVVDLTDGSGASQPFQQRTSRLRVCGNVPHRWHMNAPADEKSQYRPADAVEFPCVAQGQGWAMSFMVE